MLLEKILAELLRFNSNGYLNFIKDNFYLKYLEVEQKEKLIDLEKELIFEYKPVLNISHKYKISNKKF